MDRVETVPQHTRVAVVGESIMDVVDGQPIPGGSAANVALVLARRHITTTFATNLADDPYGREILSRLHNSGVIVAPGSVSAPRTSTAAATTSAGGDVSYLFDLIWETPELLSLGQLDVLHVGSVPALSEAGRNRLLERLHSGLQTCVTFDPNIRPALAPERTDALARTLEVVRAASIVKLSDQDAAWLYPDLSLLSVVAALLNENPRLVVLTRGADGLSLTSSDASVDVPAVPGPVRDTIGAGDTIMASLIEAQLTGRTRMLDRESLIRIGTRAAREAAITVSRVGADMPTMNDLASIDE